jgi:MULE transposase domain
VTPGDSALLSTLAGLPVCWMISSNGKMETIYFLLKSFRSRNPVIPRQVLSDRDEAQLAAIKSAYPESSRFLCLWHVLHAWRAHIRTDQYPEVWKLLQELPRMTEPALYFRKLKEIREQAPADFMAYFDRYWAPGTTLYIAI